MLDNYIKDEDGVIHQVNYTKIGYDPDYVSDRYGSYGELVSRMTHLRLGFIAGTIGLPRTILDVGYGNGDFLKTCSDLGMGSFGNDISNYPLPDNTDFIDDITSRYFNVITFYDSLEHFDNIDFVSRLRCGNVVISVPWCHNFSDEWFRDWKHRRPDEHLHHFNSMSLISFMWRKGWQDVAISSVEDVIRKPVDEYSNILTGVFKRRPGWKSY